MKCNVFLAAISTFSLAVAPALADKLGIGNPAPKLEVTEWVKGQPVDLAQTKGKKIVVLEFWATWCGPCISAIPHLTKLQAEYADKGVTVVGVTSKDPDNTLTKVQDLVKKQGDKMGYAIAFDAEGKTDEAFMKAAGQEGIPTAFVIDKAGRVAWIGHPGDGLDNALADMVAGTYDIELAAKKFDIGQRSMEAMMAGDSETVLKLADEYIALDRYALQPWAGKLMVYTTVLDQPDKALAVAKEALGVFADRPEDLAALAGMVLPAGHEHQADEPPQAHSHDEQFKALALEAVTRAAKLAPNNPQVRSSHYSVLAALERNKEALAVARTTIDLMKDDPAALGHYARVLSSPDPKNRCNDLALEAVELAMAAEPDEAAHLETKFHILAVCKQDIQAANRIGHYLVEKADEASLLNNFAWILLTEEPMMGKFNKLALAAADKCHQTSGGNNWMFLDTVALAKFENGQIDKAIELEKKALELCPNELAKLSLEDALKRFEAGKK